MAMDPPRKFVLAGIDTPEKKQPFGNVSRQLGDTVFERRIIVDYGKIDRYGRIIGKVLVAGRDASLAQLQPDAIPPWEWRRP